MVTSSLTNDERLVGLVWTNTLYHGPGWGYQLLITTRRVVGAKKNAGWRGCLIFLGTAHPKESDEEKARQLAPEVIQDKDFEISYDDITQITYRKPGFFSRGHISLKTASETVLLETSSALADGTTFAADKCLQACLVLFAEAKFVDEKTGESMRDEFYRRYHADL